MSRIGEKPVILPDGVTTEFKNDNLTIKGPLGNLTKEINPEVSLNIESDKIKVIKKSNGKFHRSIFGTVRSIINSMVEGVTEGFTKKLIVHGMGYKAEVKNNDLHLSLGFSRPVVYKNPGDISFNVEGEEITVKGIDKEKVGEVAAEIRDFRKPEPYKGKGIRYKGERVRRKAGKIAV
jgi:large subunit ribosomal protein L6